jgi:hypothetical protein
VRFPSPTGIPDAYTLSPRGRRARRWRDARARTAARRIRPDGRRYRRARRRRLRREDGRSRAPATDADPRAAALLDALSTGDALATADGRLLIQTGDTAHDALTQAATPAGDAQPVMLNNLLRTKIAGARSGLHSRRPMSRRVATRSTRC